MEETVKKNYRVVFLYRVCGCSKGLSVYKKHLAGLLLLLLLLTGCALPPRDMPGYIALLTPSVPAINGQCSGAVISPREVLTAGHCANNKRVVTATGQEAWVIGARVSTEHDVAILEVDRVLWVSEFAELGNPALGVEAQLYGYCPYQVSHIARYAYYNGLVDVTVEDNAQNTYGEWILPVMPNMSNAVCGGDSGTPIVQHGKVVGILSGGYVPIFFIPLATTAYAVPTEFARALLAQEVQVNDIYLPFIGSKPAFAPQGEPDKARQVYERMKAHEQQGRKGMAWNQLLANVASAKCMDMATRGYTGHVNPDGMGPNKMVRAWGYGLPSWYSQADDANNIESLAHGGDCR